MKKVGLVLVSALALGGALLAPVALGYLTKVTSKVEIVSFKKTLLRPTVEHGESGWITKGGTPRGKCSGDSAAGALDVATHHNWTGKYYSSVGGVFVTSIDGVKPTGSDYWSLFVNGKSSTKGICAVAMRNGEEIEFKEIK